MSAVEYEIVPGLGLSETVSVRGRFRVVKVAATATDERRLEGVPTRLVGQTLGDSRLDALDYVDGQVAVYRGLRARDDCLVSVRVFHLRGRHGDENKRLAERLEQMPKLRHDNFEQIYEVGRKGDNFFCAAEVLEGETLAEKVERDGALPPSQALDVLETVAGALTALHSRGHIHGDISPENLFLCRDGTIKILGVNQTRPCEEPFVLGGELLGNVDYIAPERIDGRSLDPASDLYALGHTFYTLLAGRAPFAGNSPIATMICHLNQEPPELQRIADGVSEGHVKLFEKMTGKTFELRYKDTQQLLADIRMVAAGREARVEVFERPEKGESLAFTVIKTSLVGAIILLGLAVVLHLGALGVTLLTPVAEPGDGFVVPVLPAPREGERGPERGS